MLPTEQSHRPVGSSLPRIAVPMGDPAGIGSEVIVKALSRSDVYERCIPVVIGDIRCLAEVPGWSAEPRIVEVATVEDASPSQGVLAVLNMRNVPESFRVGK